PEVLNNPEIVSLLLPTLRADLTMCKTYRYCNEPALECAVTAYGGEHDKKVPLAHLNQWRVQAAGAFQVRLFPGNHFFFLNESRAGVIQALRDELRPYSRAAANAAVMAPQARVERVIAVWKEVLRVSHVGLDDNFFDLGGNSLVMVQAYRKLREA